MNQFISILTSTFSMSVPLILAALGGVISVRGGVMALGLESMMTMGAFCGVLGSYYTGNVVAAVLCGIAGGARCSACASDPERALQGEPGDQRHRPESSGGGRHHALMQLLWNNKGSSPQVASIRQGVLTSPITFIMLKPAGGWNICLVPDALWTALERWWEENPKAAATVENSGPKVKYIAVCAAACWRGLGGAYLGIDHLDMYVRDMSAGRGVYCGGHHDPGPVQIQSWCCSAR